MNLRALVAVAALFLFLSIAGIGGRRVWCYWKVDGETIGGSSRMSLGEYRDAVSEESHGCTKVIFQDRHGNVVRNPDPATPIEPINGMMLSEPILVYERVDE